uniref:Peptidase S1 domain-containing protein n=1 Tax=Panagrolaimus sp. ES5 TaxID=591445 RepID=A0AC34GAH1_9BILA
MPGYIGNGKDVAIITLHKKIKMDDKRFPASTFKFGRNRPAAGTECSVAGFGRVSHDESTDVLRWAKFYVMETSTCKQLIPSLTKDQICVVNDNHPLLGGDSGAPLVCGDKNREVFGIHHGGYRTEGQPETFIDFNDPKVVAFFIEEGLDNEDDCDEMVDSVEENEGSTMK